MPLPAQIFEHGTLKVGEPGFTLGHFDALVRFNEQHGCTFFDVGHHRLHFKSFVGVLKVGSLTIEILPKAEKAASADKGKWQRALLQMLRLSGIIEVESAPEADLHTRRSPLIDLYLESFVAQVERICHAGLVKKYRVKEGNLQKLKGRIIFREQIARNHIHKERIYTAHQTYDQDNVFNRILKCALKIVQLTATTSSIGARASAVGLAFESVSDARITSETFDRINLCRHTQRYASALKLARLIILNYSPDLRSGRENILAILFDMNLLFERFVLVQLKRAQSKLGRNDITIEGQSSMRFWGYKSIRPDIIIDFRKGTKHERLILDTKWKIPKGDQPSDQDLKQMYAYNLQFGSCESVLIYPRSDARQDEARNSFAPSTTFKDQHTHGCGTHFIDLFAPDQKLRMDIGERLLAKLSPASAA
jgi:5-methylcytosine-specific restriction enzyme subunit McrC